jgi:hypothetical protein
MLLPSAFLGRSTALRPTGPRSLPCHAMARLTGREDHAGRSWRHGFGWAEAALFLLFAGGLVLFVATRFYGALAQQIFYSAARGDAFLPGDDWSAPLDDVFIHFDFARQAARGHPFEWSPGNGYSSGGTSLLYPLVLAPGFWLGFRDTRIMQFAAVLACTFVLATLLGSRRLFRALPPVAKYLAPPAFLGIGALDWSLFSGMEVAFFLAVWALALVLWDDLVHGEPGQNEARSPLGGAVALGLANAVVVATRPEGIVVVLVLSATAARATAKRHGARWGMTTLVLSGLFAGCVVVGQAVANRVFTGDWSAAGALVKLEMNDPRLTPREVWDAWVFHVRYQIGRVTGYHVGGDLVRGSFLWVLAALPLAFKKTRAYAVVLWLEAILWVLLVALNGQVRWQNERYTMPALAWMLLSAALGVGVVLSHDFGASRRSRGIRAASVASVVALVVELGAGQIPKMRDQIWFFGRASRNILDQHVKTGRRLQSVLPPPHRVLVGDAGAIPYASDIPALDIIGLGGYRDLSFARASRWGVAAAVELIERIPPRERPDVLAIYPGWWGDFPLWFGHPAFGVSVRGNVICGATTKMVYSANWSALDFEQRPNVPLAPEDRAVDSIDFGDIVSEAEHRYRITGAPGFVAMKLLESPERPSGELWDAGRVIPPGASVEFSLEGFSRGKGARILVRTAQAHSASLRVRANGKDSGELELYEASRWQEAFVEVPATLVTPRIVFSITAERAEVVLYHLWGVQRQ